MTGGHIRDTSRLSQPGFEAERSFVALAQIYKQLNASSASFAMDTPWRSTRRWPRRDPMGDTTYTSIEGQIQSSHLTAGYTRCSDGWVWTAPSFNARPSVMHQAHARHCAR